MTMRPKAKVRSAASFERLLDRLNLGTASAEDEREFTRLARLWVLDEYAEPVIVHKRSGVIEIRVHGQALAAWRYKEAREFSDWIVDYIYDFNLIIALYRTEIEAKRDGGKKSALKSSRKNEVATLIADGRTNKEIASRLVMHPDTVRRIRKKLGESSP